MLDFEKDQFKVYFTLLMIVISVALIEAKDLQKPEQIYRGYDDVVKTKILPNCAYDSAPYSRNVPAWYMVCVSYLTFDDARFIPYIVSIGILPMTYLVATAITGRPIIGLIAAGATAVNPIFLIFNDSSAFHQFWTLFLLGSIYTAYKKPILSIPLFVLATITKPMALAFMPIIAYLIWDNKKLFAGYMATGVIMGMIVMFVSTPIASEVSANLDFDMDQGLQNLWWALTKHTTPVFVGFIATVILMLSLTKDKKNIVLVGGSLATVAVICMITVYDTFPYRLLPLIVFTNIGLGSILVSLYKKKTLVMTV